MKKFTMFACLALALVFAASSFAGELPRMSRGHSMLHGGSVNFDKADLDTINLMAASDDPTNNVDPRDGGLEPYFDGDFEDGGGNPAWNGWTHWDITQPTVTHFRVDTFANYAGTGYGAWCGDPAIAACDTNDVAGGYGNSWHDLIEFRTSVPTPASSSTVTVTADLFHDSEPGYDYTYLSYRFEGQPFADLRSWDGAGIEAVNEQVIYTTPEYMGGTDIAVYFRFKADGGWSDEDCSFPSEGGCTVDNINVNVVNGASNVDYFEDFEHGGVPTDFGIWATAFPDGVGDFSYIWTGLEDNDPCNTNYTPQVAFIDDDVVIPGTGGSDCQTWCYGPGGYIVNTTGGLAGPAEHLHIALESPVMPWPSAKVPPGGVDYDGIILTFSVYRHEDLSSDAPGIFYTWGVRSADTDDSAGNGIQDITSQGWQDRNLVYYGGPDYIRAGDDVTDLMNPGRDEVQVQLAAYELGWVWYWTGNDGYPAPYFDNVTVKVFPYNGPGMSGREIDMAQDNFPARGSFDMGDLPSHSVRFDMANNISLPAHLRNDPGDTMVVDIVPVRAGAAFDGDPVLHYTVDTNPVFGPASRNSGQPYTGSVVGMPAVGISGSATPGKWAFDLPDTGFLFPGDVLHYYISATDAIGGVGGANPQTSTMPGDLTGFGDFSDPMAYNSTYVIHALPSFKTAVATDHPEILFINDFANRGGENEWYTALNNIGLLAGDDYDIYYVNAPSSGLGNGIGGRSNDIMLAGYKDIMYTAGDLSVNTITNGDFNNDPGDDVGTLLAWLDAGGNDIFMTGDDLASDMAQAGAATVNLLENYMGVDVATNDIRPLIANQTAPLVQATAANPVFNAVLSTWIAYGGCAQINTFDAVTIRPGYQRLAEFLSPAGASGAYSYSAVTLNDHAGTLGTSRVISMPYDLMYVYTDPGAPGQTVAARTLLLEDVLRYFGQVGDPLAVTPVLPGITFQTSNYPNPFNPSTTIKYTMPKTGHLSLKVYNVRGQLVKTLIDGQVEATDSGSIVWDGTNNQGSSVSSGVYFYEARTGGDVKVQKMALVK